MDEAAPDARAESPREAEVGEGAQPRGLRVVHASRLTPYPSNRQGQAANARQREHQRGHPQRRPQSERHSTPDLNVHLKGLSRLDPFEGLVGDRRMGIDEQRRHRADERNERSHESARE